MDRRTRRIGAAIVAITANAIAARAFAGYTAGDLVVLQVGLDGNSSALASTGTAVQLDEFTAGGSEVAGATVDLPTVAGQGGVNNQPITISGTAGSEGELNLSANKQFLVVGGYDVGVGAVTQGNSTVALINASGAVDSSTTTTLLATNNTRGATSDDGSSVWVGGPEGLVFIPTGTSLGGDKVISGSKGNLRDVVIAPASTSPTGSDQLFVSSNKAGEPNPGVAIVGTGLPTTTAAASVLPGMTTAANSFGFYFANSTTLFVADATVGIQEWTLSGGTWSNSATLAGQFAGITGVQNGSSVDLFATTATSSGISAQNSLVSDVFTFSSGTTGTGTFGAAATLASAAPFTEFGGVAFAPVSASGPPIWNGAGGDNNWSTGANWGGTVPAGNGTLEFAGTTRLTNNNDLAANTQFGGVQFDATAGAFVLGGNAINLNGDIVNNSSSAQTINLNLALQKNVNVNAVGNVTLGGSISNGFSVSTLGGGTVTLSGSNTYAGGTNVGAGKLVISAVGSLPANSNVSINSGTLQLNSNTAGETLASLSITNGGSLDLGNNHFILSYGAGAQATADATIRTYLTNGYAGGSLNGTGGIDSSVAAVTSGFAIGYADGADGVVAGLSSGQIEVKYTRYGDANLDGVVSGDDFTILVGNLGKSVSGWDKGDFNYDGVVSGDDFTLLVGNLGKASNGADITLPAADLAAIDAFAAANGLSLASVPEPVSASVLMIAGMGMLARRRRSI
jgi:autotransporter-associated beta strand protein